MDPIRGPQLVRVSAGALALSRRPRRKDIAHLPDFGVTHVVTLLAEREGAKDVGEAVRQAGLTWIWCPLANGQPPDAQVISTIRRVLIELASL